ncbi:MAG: PilN domain-containing protein [Proteobacteria bacterium]|nr:PilN domain-containing protein [Pseudomonadota bacterium]MBU1687545.1 PilN domain-containing protein [Pseudomonadota bacterium]
MIQINLLPVKQIKLRMQVRNEAAIFILTLFIVIVGLTGMCMAKNGTIKSMKADNQELSTKKASYQPILNEIEKLKKDKAEQETKLEVIKKLKTGSQTAVMVLDEIARLTLSNRLWLASLTQNASTLSVAGTALDNATIAQYMERINASPFFLNVELSGTSQLVVAGAKLKSFTLTIAIAPPGTSGGK